MRPIQSERQHRERPRPKSTSVVFSAHSENKHCTWKTPLSGCEEEPRVPSRVSTSEPVSQGEAALRPEREAAEGTAAGSPWASGGEGTVRQLDVAPAWASRAPPTARGPTPRRSRRKPSGHTRLCFSGRRLARSGGRCERERRSVRGRGDPNRHRRAEGAGPRGPVRLPGQAHPVGARLQGEAGDSKTSRGVPVLSVHSPSRFSVVRPPTLAVLEMPRVLEGQSVLPGPHLRAAPAAGRKFSRALAPSCPPSVP